MAVFGLVNNQGRFGVFWLILGFYWGAYWSFGNRDKTMLLTVANCEELKHLGLNVKLKNDKSKFLPIMAVKWGKRA